MSHAKDEKSVVILCILYGRIVWKTKIAVWCLLPTGCGGHYSLFVMESLIFLLCFVYYILEKSACFKIVFHLLWFEKGFSELFTHTKKGAPFAAEIVARNDIRKAMEQGMQRANIMIKGAGVGGDATLRAILWSGIVLGFIQEVTPMPHNGCSQGRSWGLGCLSLSRFWLPTYY